MMMQMGQRGQPAWAVITELQNDFTVKRVEIGADKIDQEIKVLIVIHPKDITDAAQYAIDQFVLRGGKLVAFLDANSPDGQPQPAEPDDGPDGRRRLDARQAAEGLGGEF